MAVTSTLKKITNEAKRIRAKTGSSWKSAVKAAGVAYRAGKLGSIGGVKKKSAKKKTAKRSPVTVSKTVTRKVKVGAVGSIAATKSRLKKQLEEKLSWCMMGHYNAKTKTKKRHYLKLMVPLKQQLRQLTK